MTTPSGPVGRLVEALERAASCTVECFWNAGLKNREHNADCPRGRIAAAVREFTESPPLASDEGLVRELGQLINQCLARSWRPVFMNGDENSAACLVLALVEERVLGRTPPLPGSK